MYKFTIMLNDQIYSKLKKDGDIFIQVAKTENNTDILTLHAVPICPNDQQCPVYLQLMATTMSVNYVDIKHYRKLA